MTDFILPHALPTALDGRAGVRILSLDCFDTLLWRDCHAPTDLFGSFKDTTTLQRCWSEQRARNAALVRRRRNEVTIEEIYSALLPHGTPADRSTAVDRELAVETAHCFAFRPTVALMEAARERGIETIIVSDTYLDADQLRGLIAASAGDHVAGLIGRIFCSSTLGMSKSEGMYGEVLKKLGVAPSTILHIGDNKKADVTGVGQFGVQTLHLKQFGDLVQQRLRLEASAGAMIDTVAPGTIGTPQPHRATLAAVEPCIADPAEAFGFAALGPVFHGFSRWLADEATALEARNGGRVHYLFLMRDGHLPMLAHRAAGNPAAAHSVEISRFTATAAGLSEAGAIDAYLEQEIGSDLKVVARQLLLPPAETALIFRELPAQGAARAFLKAVREPARMRRIVKASRAFGNRLVEHVRSTVNPERGDTLMLVDLGYNGSAQNEVDALLSRELGVHVAGRYLMLREQFRSGFDKAGFIDPTTHDGNTLEAMCGNVAVIEQLSTAAQGSVVDYEADGTPIRRESSIKARQSQVRERVQAGCLRFLREQGREIVRATCPDDAAHWRRAASAALMRLMFLPLGPELEVLGQFEHDINLGVDNTVALFDREIAQHGLRQRGLFYMKGSERMYLPAELQGEGLALKLSLLAHRRFGLPLKYADFVDRTISLPVIVADGSQVSTGTVTATGTHDGYFIAPVPIGDCRYSVGLQFGQLFDWVQIESAVFMPVDRFMSDKQRPGLEEIAAAPTLEGMEQTAPHLFRCEDEFSFLMVPPPPRQDDRPMMLAIVFRPIADRVRAQPAVAPLQAQVSGIAA